MTTTIKDGYDELTIDLDSKVDVANALLFKSSHIKAKADPIFFIKASEYIRSNNVGTGKYVNEYEKNMKTLGPANMLFQTMEECGELIKAISKFNRTCGIGQKTETNQADALDDLATELADVRICVNQLITLLNAETIVPLMEDKAIVKVFNRYKEKKNGKN